MGAPQKLQPKTFAYAAELLGGEDRLAARLEVTRAELERWLSGEDEPPLAVSLKVIDVIHDVALARFRGETGR